MPFDGPLPSFDLRADFWSLRFVEERTQSEIGRAIGVSQMQVSRLLAGIVARLRRQLGDLDADWSPAA